MTAPSIRQLDPDTVNQIAAGEVVERPASVVKELVENAIDAGAGSVFVEVETDADGIIRIRVADDGCGMSREDALLAFAPHATSKIRTIDDLHAIRTLGFRGEALASIAAVAQVTLITKQQGALSGTQVVVRGGEVLEAAETGAAAGTTVIVEALFYNTPARRKFQKSKGTELSHVYGVVEQQALSQSDIAFTVVHNGQERLATRRAGSLLDAVVGLYGSEVARGLIPVSKETPILRISGYVSRPSVHRANAGQIYLSVNRRIVASRPIVAAVREGYGSLLQRDRYPVAFIALDIDTGLVDVNVHPTKKEIRLSSEPDILSAVAAAVSEALGAHDLTAEPPARGVQRQIAPAEPEPPAPAVASPEPAYTARRRDTLAADRQLRGTALSAAAAENLLPAMEPIGQVGTTYIAARTEDGGLLLVDQHAAHERILYDQIAERQDAALKQQELLLPVIVNLRPRESGILREAIPLLAEEGFMVEEFGRDTYAVRAVPVVLKKLESPEIVREFIADLLADDPGSAADQKERIMYSVACRGAVKAGAVLSPEQQRRLIDQLARTATPWTCPHGRPTVIAFSKARLDAMFRRT